MRGTRKTVQLLNHRAVSGLFLTTKGEYIADVKPDEGGRIVRKFGRSTERALRLFEELKYEIDLGAQDRDDPHLLGFLSDIFLPSQQHLKGYAYVTERVGAIARFLEARFPTLRVSEVRRHHADALREFNADRSPRTWQANLQKLKQALNVAVDLELLDANPLARYRGVRFDNRRLRTCTMDEFCRLIGAAEALPDFPDILTIIGLTGLRPGNVLSLHSDDVNGVTIEIPPEKMKNARWGIVPIPGYVARLLKERRPSPWYFPSPRDMERARRDIAAGWRTITATAELNWLRPHDLRHFFASQLAKHGATEQQIGRLLCHVGQTVTSRYVHHDIEDLRPFVDQLAERYQQTLPDMD